MSKTLYTAQAHVTGGRQHGHGRSSSGSIDVDVRLPKEAGGDGEGTNPEELFAVGFASCFDSAVNTVARRMKVDPGETSVDSSVSLMTGEDRSFKLGVELAVNVPGLSEDGDRAVELVRAAHAVCPYSNATRGNVEVTLSANGRPID